MLVYAPHEEFLRRASQVLTVEARFGRAWLMRPRPGARPPGDELVCGPAPTPESY